MRSINFNRPARLLGAALLAVFVLTGCASSPKVFINENPGTDLSAYKTYNYQGTLGTDERKGYRSILSNYFIEAMDRELLARGYIKSASPDMIVNFYVHTEEKIKTTTSPNSSMMGMGGYYGYRGGYYGGYNGYAGSETRVTQYTEGTVNIDLVDKAAGELAWEGILVGRITDEVRENLKLAVSNAVTEVISEFGYTAPGFVPMQAAEGGNSG
jgi:hypothetical protein